MPNILTSFFCRFSSVESKIGVGNVAYVDDIIVLKPEVLAIIDNRKMSYARIIVWFKEPIMFL
jgi:hypothetical protein